MFNNLIYFIVVLMAYTVYQPTDETVFPILAGQGLGVLLLLIYYYITRRFLKQLHQAETFSNGWKGTATLLYHRLQMQLSILAIIFFVVQVYLLGFKDAVSAIPVIGESEALSGLMGLILFGLYLSILWWSSVPIYRLLHNSDMSRVRFIISQLRFNLPIILPWFLFSLIIDLLELVPDFGLKAWINDDVGQFVFFVVFLGLLMVILPVLIKYAWGLKPLPPGPHRRLIEDFCAKNHFTYLDIMLWPLYEGEALTAGVMGLIRRFRYVLITPALLKTLNEEELTAVIAHEIGHVKKYHLLFYFLFFSGYLVLAYSLKDLSMFALLSNDWFLELILANEGRETTAVLLMSSLPLLLGMVLYFRYILGYFMRSFERQADLYSYGLMGTIKGLVGSLEKIAYFSGQSRNLPSWHHYSVAERVDFLVRIEQNPAGVKAYNRKVRNLIIGFVIILIAVGAGGYRVHENGLGSEINSNMNIRVLKAQIRKTPGNYKLHQLLGDFYSQKSMTDEALSAYWRSLSLEPDDPITNNNMAWMLATKENSTASEKALALDLARKAAGLHAVAFILDTLAEAYYVNDQADVAAGIIGQAISLLKPGDNLKYYLKQQSKFKASANSKLSK